MPIIDIFNHVDHDFKSRCEVVNVSYIDDKLKFDVMYFKKIISKMNSYKYNMHSLRNYFI